MSILLNFLLGVYVLVALLMILVILMQRPKSEGLGAAFGAGVTENIFGAQTTNVLVKFTAWLAGIFFVLTFTLSILYAHRTSTDSGLRRELMKQQTTLPATPAPATSAAPASPGPQTSPVASAPPDSGAGIVPAGTPAATATVAPAAPAQPSETTAAKRKKPRP